MPGVAAGGEVLLGGDEPRGKSRSFIQFQYIETLKIYVKYRTF